MFILQHDSRGCLSMANNAPDSNNSQFFITYAKQSSLDYKYTLFGRYVLFELTFKMSTTIFVSFVAYSVALLKSYWEGIWWLNGTSWRSRNWFAIPNNSFCTRFHRLTCCLWKHCGICRSFCSANFISNVRSFWRINFCNIYLFILNMLALFWVQTS